MSTPLLTRKKNRPVQGISFLDDLSLTPCRAHEICGSARKTLALIIARATEGPVFWVHPRWDNEQLNPAGVLEFIDPSRLVLVATPNTGDLLGSIEEVLRAGVVPLVVGLLPELPGLTAVRRLHLAAAAGAKDHSTRPLALLLTSGNGGAQGCETRWFMEQDYRTDSAGWHLERRRARMAPPKAWHVTRRQNDFTLEPAQLRMY
ncbi:hypothetical protein OU789_03475 [Halocynthiibacter sp. C4]|uniref:ImuA family protein n=1 Tax=Halocynthiibacter sp. C4 TaxID=2992758 RepID=UPI00237A8F92|nr:hypothetical protein [Halocynthiibacter sp. C4]MDE0588982.1 hypothetical protein [Halocynthiibacter sp. C4]